MLRLLLILSFAFSFSAFADIAPGMDIRTSEPKLTLLNGAFKIEVEYIRPKNNWMYSSVPVSIKWETQQECTEINHRTTLSLVIQGKTVSKVRNGSGPSKAFESYGASKTFKFKLSELCQGKAIENIIVNGLELPF